MSSDVRTECVDTVVWQQTIREQTVKLQAFNDSWQLMGRAISHVQNTQWYPWRRWPWRQQHQQAITLWLPALLSATSKYIQQLNATVCQQDNRDHSLTIQFRGHLVLGHCCRDRMLLYLLQFHSAVRHDDGKINIWLNFTVLAINTDKLLHQSA